MPLTATLDVDPGPDAVTFTFTVRNEGDSPVDADLRSAKHADVAVYQGDEEVWRWSDGQRFAQLLQPFHLDADQSETYEFEWPDPEPGEYEAVAALNAVDGVEASDSFTV